MLPLSHQQIFKIIVRQCGAHGVDTTGYKVTPSYEQLYRVVISPRAYITVASLTRAVMKS